MTDPNMSRPQIGPIPKKEKPRVIFRTRLEETVYCRMPARPKGQHEGDLVVQLAFCQADPRSEESIADPRIMVDPRVVAVRRAISSLLDDGLLEQYGHQGERYLRKAKGDRSIVLGFI